MVDGRGDVSNLGLDLDVRQSLDKSFKRPSECILLQQRDPSVSGTGILTGLTSAFPNVLPL
jgi:hypothetical protein